MNLLFVHQNFPGQYKHLAPALAARPGHTVVALGLQPPPVIPGIQTLRYAVARGNTPGIHPWLLDAETKVIRGEAAAIAADQLRVQGFKPDLICVHPGWGEALFLHEVFPGVPQLHYCEFFYRAHGSDFDFDPEYADLALGSRCRVYFKNAINHFSLETATWGISPTAWQRRQYPARDLNRISVIHDGIATDQVVPNPHASVRIDSRNLELRAGAEIITFVNRNLEPMRGFHSFLRALPEIQRRRPQARTIIVGGDEVSYGSPLPNGQTYRQKYLGELADQLDLERIHFVGKVPYPIFLALLQVSAVHVYLTYPFVLSWSLLEAMSAGCLVVGSRTPPVEEVIRHGQNGLLVDFFQPDEIAAAVVGALGEPERMQALRNRARRTIVEGYDLQTVCLPRQIKLVESLDRGRRPPQRGK